MNKAQARTAIDAALTEQFCRLFAVLCMGLNAEADQTLPEGRFANGCGVLRKAHKLAVQHLLDQSVDDKTESGH